MNSVLGPGSSGLGSNPCCVVFLGVDHLILRGACVIWCGYWKHFFRSTYVYVIFVLFFFSVEHAFFFDSLRVRDFLLSAAIEYMDIFWCKYASRISYFKMNDPTPSLMSKVKQLTLYITSFHSHGCQRMQCWE